MEHQDRQHVVVYISKDNQHCKKVIQLFENENVSYQVKNVTDNSDYMRELQQDGIYGTPAIYIKGKKQTILGFQKQKILDAIRDL
ncbi:glutaredoxin family protein [Oceanobacillus sp. CAU 1775]